MAHLIIILYFSFNYFECNYWIYSSITQSKIKRFLAYTQFLILLISIFILISGNFSIYALLYLHFYMH